MNAPGPLCLPEDAQASTQATLPRLHHIVLAALADGLPPDADGPEARWLRALAARSPRPGPAAQLARWWRQPPPADARLQALATDLGLGDAETVAVALALAVEFEALAGRALAWLQAPVGAARPTLGLVVSLAPVLGWDAGPDGGADAVDPVDPISRVLAHLVSGPARTCGLLQLECDDQPLTEAALRVPMPLALALQAPAGAGPVPALGGRATQAPAAALWPGMRWLPPPPPLPPSIQAEVQRQAQALRAGVAADAQAGAHGLVVRSGHLREAREAAAALAAALGRRAVAFDLVPPPGAGPWLALQGVVPVLLADLAPGETLQLPALPGYRGPRLLAAGLDGQVEADGDALPGWTLPLPLPAERAALWRASLGERAADRIGHQHRHSAAQIAQLTRSALHLARLDAATPAATPVDVPASALAGTAPPLNEAQVHQALRRSGAGNLGTLAQWLPEDVDDAALVAPPPLRDALQALCQRCQRRDGLADALGPAARTRYRPGVRALLVGASGTGKTLAAGWLATRLGLPLVRVDIAAVASKYIGETEKNLAQLFARAEHAEVVLLFDEADALFGKRTELREANDRFANQQTNYLLQRIESFDGIALLTSNSRARFDSAFTRRLDAIIDFPAPGPEERRALWLAHLGAHHRLDLAAINRIAATCDLAGGHVRNATLAAAAMVAGPVDGAALRTAIEAEYRKLGRPPPAGL